MYKCLLIESGRGGDYGNRREKERRRRRRVEAADPIGASKISTIPKREAVTPIRFLL